VLADQRRGHGELVLLAELVGTQDLQFLGARHAVPTPIVAAMAGSQFVVRPRDRIAKDLQLIGEKERVIGKHGPAGFRREVGLVRRATPNVIAGADRLYLLRDLAANTRAKAVAGHEQIGTLAAAVGKVNADAISILFDAFKYVPEMVALTIDRL